MRETERAAKSGGHARIVNPSPFAAALAKARRGRARCRSGVLLSNCSRSSGSASPLKSTHPARGADPCRSDALMLSVDKLRLSQKRRVAVHRSPPHVFFRLQYHTQFSPHRSGLLGIHFGHQVEAGRSTSDHLRPLCIVPRSDTLSKSSTSQRPG